MIDWEFCYTAPASFLSSPPWWLIGTEPFEWKEEDVQDYEAKLEVFLKVLEEEEDRIGAKRTLSSLMRKCKHDGTFWYNLAIREYFPLARIMKHCVYTHPFRTQWIPLLFRWTPATIHRLRDL